MKGAIGYEAVMWIVKLFVLAMLAAAIFAITYAFGFQEVKTDVLELQLLTEELYNSNIIMQQDAHRTYPGTVDFDKFEKADLSAEIRTERKNIAVKIELYAGDGTSLGTKYYLSGEDDTEQNYARYEAISGFPERIAKVSETKPAIILKEGKTSTGYLIITALEQK